EQAGQAELQLVLELEAPPPVQQPERAARRRDGGDGPVEELDVELGGLDVRLGEIGDLGHQLADLVLRLLEQTRINGFFRHGGSRFWAPESESIDSPTAATGSSRQPQGRSAR